MNRQYYKNNKDKIRERNDKYYEEHRYQLLEYKNQYYETHKIKILEQKKQYNKDHEDQIREYHKEYYKEYNKNRAKIDLNFKLILRLRTRLLCAIKNNQKAGSAVRDLGCSIDFLKEYLESKFYANMTWSNWGKVWELDHIVPLYKFDLTQRKQFLKAVHYTNLQPLSIEDHKKKTQKDLKR